MVLALWVVSPKVPSDASMIMETTYRTIEIAMKQIRDRGLACPDEVVLWEPWFEPAACLFLEISSHCIRISKELRLESLEDV